MNPLEAHYWECPNRPEVMDPHIKEYPVGFTYVCKFCRKMIHDEGGVAG